MEVLKTLVIIVIILAVGINCEETNRKERCNKKLGGGIGGRHKQDGKMHHMRKPYPLLHHNHKFSAKKEHPTKVDATAEASSHANSKVSANELKTPIQPLVARPEREETFNMHTEELLADPMEIPSTFGISPRISISPDGDVLTFARSLNFDKTRHFHDEGIDHEHEHMDEDNDHFHKIRTARSAPAKESGPQQLSSHLDEMQGAHSQQGVNVHNGAQAGEYYNLHATGDSISSNNQGGSSVSGSGSVTSSGSTTVTTSGSSGWKQ